MRNFFHSCRFCKQAISFSVVITVYLRNVLNTSRRRVNKNNLTWRYVFKSSWRHFCETSQRCLEDVFAKRFEEVLNMSWKHLEDVLKTFHQDEYIVLDQDVLKMSWRLMSKTKNYRLDQDILNTFSSRGIFAGYGSGLILFTEKLIEMQKVLKTLF